MTSLLSALRKTAVFGGIGDCYRLELRRDWDETKPLLVVCMLNPSTADDKIDDPTIITLMRFASLWGYGGLLVVNLFAWRSSSPAAMKAASDPVGADNGRYLQAALEYARDSGGQLLAAWGNHGDHWDRAEWFCSRARHVGVDLICLGITISGQPKHPMARGKHRIPRDQQPILWRRAKIEEPV